MRQLGTSCLQLNSSDFFYSKQSTLTFVPRSVPLGGTEMNQPFLFPSRLDSKDEAVDSGNDGMAKTLSWRVKGLLNNSAPMTGSSLIYYRYAALYLLISFLRSNQAGRLESLISFIIVASSTRSYIVKGFRSHMTTQVSLTGSCDFIATLSSTATDCNPSTGTYKICNPCSKLQLYSRDCHRNEVFLKYYVKCRG